MDQRKIKSPKKFLISISSLVGFIFVWELTVFIFEIPQYLLPPISKISLEFVITFPELFKHAKITMSEACLGFIIANSLGTILAILFTQSKTTEWAIKPYVVGLQTTPISRLHLCLRSGLVTVSGQKLLPLV